MADFGKAAECSLAPVIRGESLEDCQYCVVIHGKVLWGFLDEEILAALGHLPEYPTCSKAMGRRSVRRAMKLTRPVEPSFQYGSTPWDGLWFLGN